MYNAGITTHSLNLGIKWRWVLDFPCLVRGYSRNASRNRVEYRMARAWYCSEEQYARSRRYFV
jgi:hypothetical protein